MPSDAYAAMVAVVGTPHAPADDGACGVHSFSVKQENCDALLVRGVSGRGRRRGRGAQVARGLVGGAARLARGDTRGALAEAAGGLAAPVVSAVHQFSLLGADVYQAATSLTAQRARKRMGPSPFLRRRLPGRGEGGRRS